MFYEAWCVDVYWVYFSVCVCAGGSDFQPVLSGPSRAYLRSRVQFHCEVPGWTSPLTYELRKDDGHLVATEVNTGVTFSLKVTEGSKGKYYCRLTPGGQSSNTVHFQVVSKWNKMPCYIHLFISVFSPIRQTERQNVSCHVLLEKIKTQKCIFSICDMSAVDALL